MTPINGKKDLSGREMVVIAAMRVFYPPKTNNKVNGFAVMTAVDDYNKDPSKQAEILKELSTLVLCRKRLQDAQDIYSSAFDTKHLIKQLYAKIEDGFKKQDGRLGALEVASKKHVVTNKEQAAILNALKNRAEEAEEKAKRQKPWAVAGKVLSGLVGALLAFCTILGVPTKYTQPLIDKVIDPALEKVGLYRPEKTQKAKETSQQPIQMPNNAVPQAVTPPSIPQPPAPAVKRQSGTQQQSNNQCSKNDGTLACYRSGFVRKPLYRIYHV